MGPPASPPRARASVSHLPPVRKNGSIDFRLNRTSVGDEYGAGPPEVRWDSEPGVLRRGRKRDFSPYLNRGLGESHSTQYAVPRSTQYARKVCGPCLVDTKAGKSPYMVHCTSNRTSPHDHNTKKLSSLSCLLLKRTKYTSTLKYCRSYYSSTTILTKTST